MNYRQWFINLTLLAALILLVVGLIMPVLTLEKFYVFSNEVSLLSALEQLWLENDWGLLLLLGTFSVVFPILKIVFLLIVTNFEQPDSERHKTHLHWLAIYSKWSMLDVFVVALLVVSVKLSVLAQAQLEVGIYAFAASVILTMLVSHYVSTADDLSISQQ